MKKTISVLLAIVMLVCVLPLSVSAVSVDTVATGDNDVYIDIYLYADAESPVVSAQYTYGDIPVRPEDPGREDLTFIDWYTSPSFSYRFDFSEPLYEDTAIYARFVPEDQVIGVNVFASPGDDYPLYGYLCAKGDIMEYPASPDYGEDEDFLGWYSDRAMTKKVDFSEPIYDYTNLFPRILPYSALCTGLMYLDAQAQDPLVGFTVPKGECCPVPDDPGREDCTFDGWYSDRALTKPFDFTKPVYEDFSLFPKFTPIHYHDLQMVPLVPATNTTDGCKAHLVCTTCGKWFEPTYTALIEITDHESQVIRARGPYKLGDADGNGTVAITDVTLIQRKLAKMSITTSFCRSAADVDSSGKITAFDATWIQRKLSKMDIPYAVGESFFEIPT